ncbi:MAG: signal peptidase I [Acidobacteriota bacterium]|nr:MAG: signal peptidase I [Acidobacteriota bacterium]
MAKQSTEATQPEQQQYSTLREYFIATVYCTIIALFVTTYVVHPMTVPTPSMEPTILVGDRLLIDKFTFRNSFLDTPPLTPAHAISRGDIVVFKFPEEPEVLYVKRAIGLPGESLEIRNKQVYINGQALEEPYKVHSDTTIRGSGNPHFLSFDSQRDNFGPVTIPEGNYFMMGDNRDDSADSRYFGFLPRDYIVGRPMIVFWSYEDDDDAYKRTSLAEMAKLYAERVVFFFTRTRWSRTGHFVR